MVVDYALLIKAIRKTLIPDQTRPDQISRLDFYVILDFLFFYELLWPLLNVTKHNIYH